MFDNIFVDEGQDWPNNEIFLLNKIYKANQINVADGEDQYVRGKKAFWHNYSTNIMQKTRKLKKCLRMKENLTKFVSELANSFGVNEWDLEPNIEASGGRVVIYEGDMTKNTNIYLNFKDEAKRLGNYPVDLLACVPPSFMVNYNDSKISKIGKLYQELNIKVWDGTSDLVRKEFCKDRDALRIVQYDSSRGLEGWIVFNYEMDEFWNYKYQQMINSELNSDDLYTSEQETSSNPDK
jgi:hypothetical protein